MDGVTLRTGFEVVMDDGRFELVEVFEGTNHLADHSSGFPFGDGLLLLQIEIQIVSFHIFQHCGKPIPTITRYVTTAV